eukprot:TRINITY_DN1416_c0_g1_i2.p1 TRINITY_DN1416_c0_g1~~TRINITY_DN1416_c0_g1_i2.p1  ORF type:complete len:482 (+),score=27.47 TRINITY_DN1416_c0_g1_i2:144-1589(+)
METIVLFPFMAQGHLNPFLDLARLLATRTTLTITIVSTPGNVLNLRPLFTSTPSIRLAELPFKSSDYGLPENVENTDALPPPVISHFYRIAETLKPVFHDLISRIAETDGRPPICIVSDMFTGWTFDVAESFGAFHAIFYTSGPYAMSIYNSVWSHLPHLLTCADEFTLPDLPADITISRSQLSKNIKAATFTSPSAIFVKRQAEYCQRSDGSLWNTSDLIEKSSLEMWGKSTKKPVWAIGPVLPKSPRERGGREPVTSSLTCTEWLNLHPPKSVLYVSFGSQNSVPADHMMELAKGLEASGKAFMWVVRPPIGFDVRGEFRPEWLPEGFEDRMREKKKGFLVKKWGPQLAILSHASTGAFLSHCGWNSVLESLSCGVPIVGWPLGSEQFYNSKLMEEELGVCVEVGRGVEEMIRGDEVAEKVRIVIDGERGREMRRRAEVLRDELQRVVEDGGSSVAALDGFVETVMAWRGRVAGGGAGA